VGFWGGLEMYKTKLIPDILYNLFPSDKFYLLNENYSKDLKGTRKISEENYTYYILHMEWMNNTIKEYLYVLCLMKDENERYYVKELCLKWNEGVVWISCDFEERIREFKDLKDRMITRKKEAIKILATNNRVVHNAIEIELHDLLKAIRYINDIVGDDNL
jgi:hypothetical protein